MLEKRPRAESPLKSVSSCSFCWFVAPNLSFNTFDADKVLFKAISKRKNPTTKYEVQIEVVSHHRAPEVANSNHVDGFRLYVESYAPEISLSRHGAFFRVL